MKKTPNYGSWRFVDKREPFQGSNLRGEAYAPDAAPHMPHNGQWMNEYETEMYGKNRPRITYIVWSFYTPIAYYVETPAPPESPTVPLPGQWYKVGQSFSPATGRHQSGALRNVPGHMVALIERRGHNTVNCFDCDTSRVFAHVNDARQVYYNHR